MLWINWIESGYFVDEIASKLNIVGLTVAAFVFLSGIPHAMISENEAALRTDHDKTCSLSFLEKFRLMNISRRVSAATVVANYQRVLRFGINAPWNVQICRPPLITYRQSQCGIHAGIRRDSKTKHGKAKG